MLGKKQIGLFVLTMFIVGSIDSLRNMPTAAMFGSALIFFFVAAAISFLIPIALISAELTSYHPDKNGVYQWIKEAFGDKVAFFGIWLQWINTATWFPSILSFIAGGVAYLVDPSLATHKLYFVSVILGVFWLLTWLSIRNFSLSARFTTVCTILGFLLPFCVMVGALIVWQFKGNPLQFHINTHDILPKFGDMNNWISLTAVITSFLGMELAAVNVQNVQNAKRNYPIGVLIASAIILLTMIWGSLAIAYVIPGKQISLTTGIFETIQYYLNTFHLSWAVYVICGLVVLSSLGEMMNWIISPARGLQQAAESGELPRFFVKNNTAGMPSHVLLTQAILVSLVCLAFNLFQSINDIYWLLTDLSTELYVMMYVMMFLAAIVLHYKHKHIKKDFCIPGGTPMKWLLVLMGLISCSVTLFIGFIPPGVLNFGSNAHYALVFGAGIVVMCLPGLFFMLKSFGRDG